MQLIQDLGDAIKLIDELRLPLAGGGALNSIAWGKLWRASIYLSIAQKEAANAYFSDEEVAA